jgi:hypothetical protein
MSSSPRLIRIMKGTAPLTLPLRGDVSVSGAFASKRASVMPLRLWGVVLAAGGPMKRAAQKAALRMNEIAQWKLQFVDRDPRLLRLAPARHGFHQNNDLGSN